MHIVKSSLSPYERIMMEQSQIQLTNLCNGIATEESTVASRPYKSGDYFFLNGIFCRAKVNIAQGSRFTLNTNYEERILADELTALNHQ